ncbi:hypothetical protein J0A68_07560 [Algoriphagus sp. H41]|uniref:Uncharacterized protein n=1 Tax=Algoriphagus oliviformis TaxID=2811231 RepID=A0ABS3C2H3_9BACT|nr:hypothetical protein [Algoriphagus oliviformis]MBN7810806.1 hypothetical protein [Algoriphagus oliviformis]
MKRCFEIKAYISFEKTQFYTIEEVGKGINETDEFFIRFKDNPDYQKDIATIKYWIQKIGKESGALERHFRPEKSAEAIPITISKLRLYCYRLSDKIVILGNGGIKSSQKVQDSPDAFPHFEVMNTLAFAIQMKLESGQIEITSNHISGDLTFFTK